MNKKKEREEEKGKGKNFYPRSMPMAPSNSARSEDMITIGDSVLQKINEIDQEIRIISRTITERKRRNASHVGHKKKKLHA